jgi:hypothetical protein
MQPQPGMIPMLQKDMNSTSENNSLEEHIIACRVDLRSTNHGNPQEWNTEYGTGYFKIIAHGFNHLMASSI